MKTIKQIADEIGVSKQAVHQKRKTKELSTALQPFTSIVDGIVYISVDGEKLIKSAFKKDMPSIDLKKKNQVSDNQFTVNFTLETLSKQLEEKDKQLSEKDKQIEKLQGENEKLITSLENMTQSLKGAQALHAGTIQQQIEQKEIIQSDDTKTPEEVKKGFFSWFKKMEQKK